MFLTDEAFDVRLRELGSRIDATGKDGLLSVVGELRTGIGVALLEALEHECWQGRHNDPVEDLLRVAKTLSRLEPLAAILDEVLK